MKNISNKLTIPTKSILPYLKPKESPQAYRTRIKMRYQWCNCLLAATFVHIMMWKLYPRSQINKNIFVENADMRYLRIEREVRAGKYDQ